VFEAGAHQRRAVGDMLVQNPGGERYLVPQAKFVSKYEPTGDQANQERFGTYRSVSSPWHVFVWTVTSNSVLHGAN
jgi:hypothetical protein